VNTGKCDSHTNGRELQRGLKNVSDNSITLLLGTDLVIDGMSGHLTVWLCATGGLKPKQMKNSDVI
jgi:hypothetical protein